MIGEKHNLIGPAVFPVGQNVQCVFCLVGKILILVGHCPISDRYFILRLAYIYIYIYVTNQTYKLT